MNTQSCLGLMLLFFVPVYSTGTDYYCCYFQDQTTCNWINTGPSSWTWLGDELPDLTNINNFIQPTDSNYSMWLQSTMTTSAHLNSTNITMVLNEGDKIIVSLYRSSILGKVVVKFQPENVPADRAVELFESKLNGWTDRNAIIGTDLDCCKIYPCQGTINVYGTIQPDSSGSNTLIAFKNFLINDCPVPTTTTSTTTLPPPPPNDLCNQFEVTSDEWTLDGWIYSFQKPPEVPITEYTSEYAYSTLNDGAKLTSPIVQVNIGDTFTFNYLMSSTSSDPTNYLLLYFYDADSNTNKKLNYFYYENDNWSSFSSQCSQSNPFCDEPPCIGQFVWEAAVSGSATNIYAVDSIQLNYGCVNSATCCGFESQDICNMESDSSWTWSKTGEPDPPITSKEDGYVWWEDNNDSSEPQPLKSSAVTLYLNSTINVQYYSHLENIGSGELLIWFSYSDISIPLVTVAISSEEWRYLSIPCVGETYDCCEVDSGCNGQIEFVPVSINSGDKLYAIDSLVIDNEACPIATHK